MAKKYVKKENTIKPKKNKVIVDKSPEIKSQVFEESNEVNGLEQLKIERERIIDKWKESGLLDESVGNVDENTCKMFESKTSHVIDEPEKLAEPVKTPVKKRTVADLNQSEFRVYQRTGFIPQ
jgi:hypothetical protein